MNTIFDSRSIGTEMTAPGQLTTLGKAVRGHVANALRAVARWHLRHQTHRQLMALNDHLLADIGLRREDLRQVADQMSLAALSPRSAGFAAVAVATVDATTAPQAIVSSTVAANDTGARHAA